MSVLRAHWALTTAPTDTVISVETAKAHVFVTHDDMDDWFTAAVKAATELVESRCRRGLFTQTWTLTLSGWPAVMWLPWASPLQSVTVQYYDASNVQQTLSSAAYVTVPGDPAELHLAYAQTWPALYSRPNAVTVTYVIGWASRATIPMLYKQAILFLVGHWWSHRESVALGTISTEVAQTFDAACELAGVIRNEQPFVAAA